ncbi:MAG TPA: PDZ domain-containing protein [Bacteroidales bacterium]|nr:PDZ domain-containing protein [Bacteroidales bacterium]
MKRILIAILAVILLGPVWAQEKNAGATPNDEARLMRFPAIHGNQVVFTYAGDLYTVDRQGGVARKLTNDETGYEMFSRFSPDGKNIAFTGQYDGNTEVFMIPAEGGTPKRLTYTATLGRDDISDRMGPNNIVMTWKDNENIVFRSRKQSFNDFKGQLFLASVNGGLPEELPLPSGGFCSYSPDKSKLAYNRVFREFRTWKYYRGGMADDIWIYDFKTKQVEDITNNPAQDIFPMWTGDKIYFCSDRDRIMNLFVYDLKTKETKKVTQFTDYDIKFPSLGDNAIVFENGGYIYVFDLATQKAVKLDIRIPTDLITSRSQLKDAGKLINSYSLAPDGKRICFDARGDIWTVPAKTGITRNLTQSSGVHERDVAWSPDGKYIAYISDQSGDNEIYILKQDGTSQPEQITRDADTYRYAPIWSPDSKKLLWADKLLRLQYVDITSKEVTPVDQATDWEFTDFDWSPDSKWIAYARPDRNAATKIYLFELASKTKTAVTDGWYDCTNPAFSLDGKYLFFTSNRDFNPIYSWTEWNHAYEDMTKVYFLTLAKKTPSPFAPENDEVAVKPEEKPAGEAKPDEGKDKKEGKKEEGKPAEAKAEVTVNVDLDGIVGRIVALPIDAGSYWNVSEVGDNVYYVKAGGKGEKSTLMMFSLKDKKESPLGDFNNYVISADTKKMLVTAQGKYAVIDLPRSKIDVKDWADLSNMKVMVDLKAEWSEIFHEAWRQMKYFYFAPNMSGVDWAGIQKKYEALVPYINNRHDLNYILGEMVGELSTGHTYIEGGDRLQPARVKLGLLGARLSRDASGYYKIDEILKGENWTRDTRSPLTELGVDVKEGDYIIAVDGKSTKDMTDIYESLVNTAGDQVELTVNGKAGPDGAHKIIVVPTDNEEQLYYYKWVQNNIKKVSDATNGQVGYIHIPDMGPEGLNEFVKHFYPQLAKRALIIDDRGNGGGNVSPMIIERLNREMTMIEMSRNTGSHPGRLDMEWGPKVLLIDNYSASDGDLFPYQFKKLKIGKVIGERTWGGVVGIRGGIPFVDGGTMRKPEFAPYDNEGKEWIIEGHGVEPDIYVDNDPAKEYAGEDQQLNKAIEVVLDELKSWPKELPPPPPYPDKTK